MSSAIDLPTVISALSRPETYPHPVWRQRAVQTHTSCVFLTGKYVHKIKKPINFGFLDYSTLERRRQCWRATPGPSSGSWSAGVPTQRSGDACKSGPMGKDPSDAGLMVYEAQLGTYQAHEALQILGLRHLRRLKVDPDQPRPVGAPGHPRLLGRSPLNPSGPGTYPF